MRTVLAAGLGVLVLAGCHGARCADTDSPPLTTAEPDVSAMAARSVALDALYEREPTRALLDTANVEQIATGPAVYRVHITMTGSPETRAIYEVEVSEQDDGLLTVTSFTKVQ